MRSLFGAIVLSKISSFIDGIIEGRDPDLNGHHQRLANDVLGFADYIGCTEDEKIVLSVSAGIHDLGKLSISEHILNKPARLTATEYSLVKTHSEIGYNLLLPLRLDTRISDVVRFHHENFDGTGYPAGLSGDKIPYLARIVRILDSFDALTMDRPYHKGVEKKEALALLRLNKQHYDPSLLEAFCTYNNQPTC